MNFSTPFVEYLIIGTHVSAWLAMALFGVWEVPLPTLGSADAAVLVVLLPFVYLLGMTFDQTAYLALKSVAEIARASVLGSEDCPDEFIAYKSTELYNEYLVRVRRVRILAAAIFNWPILAFVTVVAFFSSLSVLQITAIAIVGGALSLLSAVTWYTLFKRAYRFRRRAYHEIRGGLVTGPPPHLGLRKRMKSAQGHLKQCCYGGS